MLYRESSYEDVLQGDKLFVIPIPNNWKDHYLDASICAMYISNGVQDTIVPFDMVDEINVGKNYITFKDKVVYTSDKKLLETHWAVNSYDINTAKWLDGCENNVTMPDDYRALLRLYTYEDVNRYISPLKHLEYCRAFKDIFPSTDVLGLDFYQNTVYPGLRFLEKSGIVVDGELYREAFGKLESVDVLKTDYNLHTLTGRPSNSFNGVNFSALKKDSLQRQCIKSRFEKGKLYEFDFDAYHVRLIGRLLDYSFKEDSVHAEFGKEYFHTDTLSDEEYQQSKQITFKNMYSTVDSRYSNQFFIKVDELKEYVWNSYKKSKYLQSPISKRAIAKNSKEKMYKSKAFNYFIQAIETDFSMIVIYRLKELLKNYKSKFMLYTYDSFLFDVHPDEDGILPRELYNCLTKNKMHVKTHSGENYNHMKNYQL